MITRVIIKRAQNFTINPYSPRLTPGKRIAQSTKQFIKIAPTSKRAVRLKSHNLGTDQSVFLDSSKQIPNISHINIGTLISCIGVIVYDPKTKITFALHASPKGSIDALNTSVDLMLKKYKIPVERIKAGLFYSENLKTYSPENKHLTHDKLGEIRSLLQHKRITPKVEILNPADDWIMTFYPNSGTWSAKTLYKSASTPRSL